MSEPLNGDKSFPFSLREILCPRDGS